MFRIPVGDILSSFAGDSKEFSFSGEIYSGYYEDIEFLAPLEFRIKIVCVDSGIAVLFKNLKTTITYENKKHAINIAEFERHFQKHIDPLSDLDDIQPIHNDQIDLGPIIREEIIMATHLL